MATAAVQTAIYQMGYETGDSVSKLNAARAAANDVVKANEQLAVTEEKVTRATRTTTDSMDKMLAKLDPRIRAEQQLARTIEQVERLQRQGIGTTDQAARAVELAQQKVDRFRAANDNATRGVAAFNTGLNTARSVLGAFGVSLGLIGLVQFGRKVFQTTADLQEQADQILGAGGNVEALQAFRMVFAQNGVTVEQGDKILSRLTRTLGEAAEGSKQAQDAFKRLGLGSKELAGVSADAALPLVAQRLLQIKDASVRAAIETDIFSRSGQKLESSLKALTTPMEDLISRGKELGVVIDADMIQKADEANDKMSLAFMKLSTSVAPIVVQLAEAFSKLAGSIGSSTEALSSLMHQAVTFGGTAAGARLGFSVGGLPGAVAGGFAGGLAASTFDSENRESRIAAWVVADGRKSLERADLTPQRRKGIEAEVAAALEIINSKKVTAAGGALAVAASQRTTLPPGYPWGAAPAAAAEAAAANDWKETEAAAAAREKALKRQLDLMNAAAAVENKQAEDERRHAEEKRKAQNEWGVAEFKLAEERAKKLKEEEDRERELAEDRRRNMGEYLDQLREDVDLAGMSREERERQMAVLDLQHTAMRKLTDVEKEQVTHLIAARQETERWQGVVEDIGSGFRGFFEELFGEFKFNWEGLMGSFRSTFARVLAAMAEQALMQPIIIPMVQSLMGSIGGVAGALGLGGSAGGGIGGMINTAANLGAPGGLFSQFGLDGTGVINNLGGAISGGLNYIGGALGFATPATFSSAAGLSGAMGGISTSSIPVGMGASPGIFGGMGLGGALGMFGMGSMLGGMMGGNSLVSGALGMGGAMAGGALLGSTLGAFAGPLGMLAGAGLGALLGDFGASNKASWADFSGSGWSISGATSGDQANVSAVSAVATAVTDTMKALQAAGIDVTNPARQISVGHEKGYVVWSNGQKQKLQGDDPDAILDLIMGRMLASAKSENPQVQALLSRGGLSQDNLQQFLEDVGFAKTFTDFDFGINEQLTQTEQLLKNIADQYDELAEKAGSLGLDLTELNAAKAQALQDVTDGFNDRITAALDAITGGPLTVWNAMLTQQNAEIAEAKAASADMANLEKLHYFQRKQLLMQLNDAERTSLEGMIGLADELAVKVVALQAAALSAVGSQIAAAQGFAQQQGQISAQYGAAGSSINSARVGFLVDPNFSRASAMDTYRQSRDQLQQLAGKSDLESLNAIGGAAQAFLQNSLGVNASSTAYHADFAWVQGVLGTAKATADAQAAATMTQAQMAQQQLEILAKIQAELVKPSPDTEYLSKMLAQLEAINGGITLNSAAIIATIQADTTAAALDSLGQVLQGTTETQQSAITAALETLRGTLLDGLVTVAEADPVRGALEALQGVISDQLAHQDTLSQGQLTAALHAQAILDQIKGALGTGIDVTNLSAIAGPLNQLINLTAGTVQQIGNLVDTVVATGTGGDPSAAQAASDAAAAQAAAAAAAAGGPMGLEFYDRAYDQWYQWQPETGTYLGADGTTYQGGSRVSGFAKGTMYAPGGMAWVGEEGPELVNLPRGSQVYPNNIARNLSAPGNDNAMSALLAELQGMRRQLAALQAEVGRGADAQEETAEATQGLKGEVRQSNTASLFRTGT